MISSSCRVTRRATSRPPRFHPARSSDVKSAGSWPVDVERPNTPSLARLARPTARVAAATARLPAPPVETPTCASAAVAIMRACA
eukprot:4623433-Pleurochrysis_carterae.AAC.1